MRVFRAFSWRSLVGAISIAAFLAGCGGSPSDDDGDTAAPSGSASGVFTDAPVNGLNYVASPSGVTGVTGDNGTNGGFRYEPGDTITFSLGGLTLGSSEGAASVSPADIASDDPVVAANLLVLLQSLDSNPAEGVIQITLPASTSLAGLSLTQSTATFSAAPAFTSAVTAAGGTVVSLEDAKAHAVAQFWAQVAGVWVLRSDEGTIIFRVDDQGNYLIGESGAADDTGGPGMEIGSIAWDPTTQRGVATVGDDTNGEWGLSHPRGDAFVIRFDGTSLLVRDVDDAAEDWTALRRSINSGALPGVWAVEMAEGVMPPVASVLIAFDDQGRYLMVDPIGDVSDGEGDPICGSPGVEGGQFTLSTSDSTGLTLAVTGASLDTNGCAGLNEPIDGGPAIITELRDIVISSDGNTLTADTFYPALDEGDGPVTLRRVLP